MFLVSNIIAQPQNVEVTTEIMINPTDHVNIELPCGIQPGALIQKYSVSWKKLLVHSNTVTILRDSKFNLSISTTGQDALQYSYECIVTVQHEEYLTKDYDGGCFIFKETTVTGDLYSTYYM